MESAVRSSMAYEPRSLPGRRSHLPLALVVFGLALAAILLGSLNDIVPRGLYWLERQAGELAPISADQALTLGHLFAYAAAAVAGGLAFGSLLPNWLLAAALFGSSLTIELIQAWLPSRDASLNDLLANAAGLCLGLGCLFVLRRLRGT